MLKQLFSAKVLTVFAMLIAYNIAAAWWLWRIGFWDVTMLYDTVNFIVVGAIGSTMRAATRGLTYDLRFFLKTVVVNIEAMVVFVFLVDFFPLNFWVEFLLVIPGGTLLATIVVYSEYQSGAEQVRRFLIGVQSLVGFAIIGYVVWQVATNYEQLLDAQVLFSLLLPFVMSVLFIPGLFLVCSIFAYEDAFLVVSLRSKADKRLATWKKWWLLLRFGLNLKALQTFRRSPAIHEYGRLKTKEESQAYVRAWRASVGG